MPYKVKITYTGIAEPIEKSASPICSVFAPTGSYIDTAVYTEGHPLGAEADAKNYGKSIYASNVDNYGKIQVKEPFATTSIPYPVALAQFKVSAVSDKPDAKGHPYVEFEVNDYKEAFYYKEIASALEELGFVVEVTDLSDAADIVNADEPTDVSGETIPEPSVDDPADLETVV